MNFLKVFLYILLLQSFLILSIMIYLDVFHQKIDENMQPYSDLKVETEDRKESLGILTELHNKVRTGKIGEKVLPRSHLNVKREDALRTKLESMTESVYSADNKLQSDLPPKIITSQPSQTNMKKDYVTLAELHNKIWKQIEILQEEGDCEKKKILYCQNSRAVSGLGSMIHRYGVCMQIAFGLGRTWFINQVVYEKFGGLKRFLRPESKKCGYLKEKYMHAKKYNLQERKNYIHNSNKFEVNNTYKVMVYDLIADFPHPNHIPTTIPFEIEQVLVRYNIHRPWVWFTSQFLGYLLHPFNANFTEKIKNISDTIHLTHPYVALHIRRGDKISSKEAAITKEITYFNEAEKYFNEHFPNITQRTIYLASDQFSVRNNLIKLVPKNYKILARPSFRKDQKTKDRFSLESIETMFIDIYFLAHSDYTVCTYSSNIGRLIYELKQTMAPFMADNHVITVDEPKHVDYWWNGYMNWFFHLYYVTISGSAGVNIQGLNFLRHGSAQLMEFNGTTTSIRNNGRNITVCYVRTKYRVNTQPVVEQEGYVFEKNLAKWPGNPKYYFYP